MIKRELYMNRIRPFIGTELIKVMTGIRRCGKSVMLELIKQELIESGVSETQLFAINFEDLSYSHLQTAQALHDEVIRRAKEIDGKVYLFFDEIQEVKDWEKCINSFRVSLDCDIYITGSNANLLSGEFATYLGGRYVEFVIYPFSFAEYLTYYGITDRYDEAFDRYVRTGGMPGSYVYRTEDRQYDYVKDVYATILIRDLVEKYKIRNKSEFTNISEFMMDNIGNLLSPNNISKTLKNDQSEITRKTVSKYIGYLENAFLFYEAKRYDLKGKKYLANNSKYYLCDTSFRYAVNGTRNMDFGRVYENIVYLELRRRGYEVYVGKLYKKEVDFVAKKRETQIYIQVSDNISDEKTFEREYTPLLAIRDAYPKMIIARTHHETYDYKGVQVVDICRWLRE